jgi:hypothetical protein
MHQYKERIKILTTSIYSRIVFAFHFLDHVQMSGFDSAITSYLQLTIFVESADCTYNGVYIRVWAFDLSNLRGLCGNSNLARSK